MHYLKMQINKKCTLIFSSLSIQNSLPKVTFRASTFLQIKSPFYNKVCKRVRHAYHIKSHVVLRLHSDLHITAFYYQFAREMLCHNPPLPGLPDDILPILNHDRTDHNTKPMEHLCIAIAWSSYFCMRLSLCCRILQDTKWPANFVLIKV